MPETLDETYARALEDIGGQNWECAHRLFQCVAAASRPLRVKELAEFLAFDFEEESTPTFLADWRPEDPAQAVLSTCSSLLTVVTVDGSPVIQFAHFSVKEYLTSGRLAEAKDTISRFHVSMIPAHTIVARACLGVLLHLGENITKDGLEDFPLAEYAAEHWVEHARFESVASEVQDGMKRLFDPCKSHLSVWDWIYDSDDRRLRFGRSESRGKAIGTPLHYAASSGIHDIATFLIVEHSQDVNARGFSMGETPLHVAMRLGHVEVARVLLEHGADREPRDNNDWSPLERASYGGRVELVQVLLKYGADANARDTNGDTPLYCASYWGVLAVVRALIKHGADVKARHKDNQTPLHVVKTEEVARVLLEHGADANALETKNQTPLHVGSKIGRVGVVRVLLEHGVDANARDANSATPLHLGSKNGRVDVVRVLLEHGVDANARDSNSATPLHLGSKNGEVDVVRVLLEHGVDANVRDANSATPLHFGSRNGLVDVVRVLLEHGVDANARDANSATPLHLGSENGLVDVVRVLLEHGVDANARDANNATPLHLASGSGLGYEEEYYFDVVRLLLQYGSDIHALDNEGQTSFIRTTKREHRHIMQFLLENGAEDHRK